MTGQRRAVYKEGVVADAAIVSNVGRREKQIPAADGSDPAAFYCPAVHGHVFAEYIFIADQQVGSLAAKSPILWIAADRAKRMKHIAATELCRSLHHCVRMQDAAVAQLHIFANDGVRTDLNTGTEFRARCNDRVHMDVRRVHFFGASFAGCGSRSTILHINVASAAS